MGNARESLLPVPNYNTPVKVLSYKDLLTSTTVTFTLVSHESGIKTWCVLTTYPERVYCDDKNVSVWKVQLRMLNGSQHWRNNWQGKDCHTVQRITTNIEWSSYKESFGSSDRNPYSNVEWQKDYSLQQVIPMENVHVSVTVRLYWWGHRLLLSLWNVAGRRLSGMVFLQLLLMILSFGRSLSQLLTWTKQPCTWARELILKRGTLVTSRYIHEEKYFGDRQQSGWSEHGKAEVKNTKSLRTTTCSWVGGSRWSDFHDPVN